MRLTLVNKALPVHHTATTDEPWDGPAAVAAMPSKASVLYYCHAWQADDSVDSDADDEDNDADDRKANYKFPHHATKGGPANLNACRNGLARLSNADIPDKDREGVRKHLQAHLDDAEEAEGEKPGNRVHHPFNGRSQGHRRAQGGPANRGLRISNASGLTGPAEVFLYDEISWWGVTADDFVAQLREVTAGEIVLHVNSPGGDVFDGLAIYNSIKAHPATVTAKIEGLAASAASFIVMAADTVEIARNAQMMIHNAQGMVMGDDAEMRKTADLLAAQNANIADIYRQRAGGTQKSWLDAMAAESWYIGSKAVDAGLADKVIGDGVGNTWSLRPSNTRPQVAARVDPDLPEGFSFLEAFNNAFKGGL